MLLINESGLVRAVKYAYKHGGYSVSVEDGMVSIYAEQWFVRCKWEKLPRKVLCAIVEHMGMIPDDVPMFIEKDGQPQTIMENTFQEDMARWTTGEKGANVTYAPVIMQGLQVYQTEGGGPCYGVSLLSLEILDQVPAELNPATVVDSSTLMWEKDDEAVVIMAVRKAVSSWGKAWEKAVWTALESVDCHREGI